MSLAGTQIDSESEYLPPCPRENGDPVRFLSTLKEKKQITVVLLHLHCLKYENIKTDFYDTPQDESAVQMASETF